MPTNTKSPLMPLNRGIQCSLQVALACELNKPLFMHCRDAGAQFEEILRRHAISSAGGVLHCFTGNAQELQACLDLGLCIGITGWCAALWHTLRACD